MTDLKITVEQLRNYPQSLQIDSFENEEWRHITEFPGYMVSNYGRVKSLEKKVTHNYGGKAIKKERILKQVISNGYYCVSPTLRGKSKSRKVHRLMAIEFIPNPELKPQINHIDGDKLNNSLNNLEWSTCGENVRHAWENGLAKKYASFIELSSFMNKINNYLVNELRVTTPIGDGTIILDQANYRIQYDNGKLENLVKSVRYWGNEFKIHCFKLSDLDKEIEHNGERFVPINELTKFTTTQINHHGEIESCEFDGNMMVTKMPDEMDWYRIQKLFEWHFWPFGENYFENGLVIDKMKIQNG